MMPTTPSGWYTTRARPGRHRKPRAHREDGRPVSSRSLAAPRSVEERVGALARGVDQATSLPRSAADARRRGDDHLMPPPRQLGGRLFDELVDLVSLAPRQGRHMGDP